ncbi:MAG TPA: methyltransferase domain-containing protein, partial [Ignavibacteriaceae bacterium]|nr:methyltransferase domain-containing protein [Ignavibacteriaceae bacterium]
EEMISRANLNKSKLGFTNIEFKLGEIENIPIEDNLADVVLSNCVLNLVPNKKIAFSEIYRIIKPGGHFCVSDIVLNGKLPAKIKASVSLYTCCIAGAISKDEYVQIIKDAGFSSVSIKSDKRILISNEFLEEYLTGGEIRNFKKNQNEIISITIVAYKN